MGVSIHEIARAADCSIATVSRVFNQRPNVRSEVKKRVLSAAHQLGYSPKLTARRDCVAIVTENVDEEGMGPYETTLISELMRRLQLAGFRMEIIPQSELEVFKDKFFQGVISLLYLEHHVNQLAALCRNGKLPLVTINHEIDGCAAVCSDERQGMRLGVEYLAKFGHREIALVVKKNDTVSQRNRCGFFAEIMRGKFGIESPKILYIQDLDHVAEEILKLLQSDVTALLVAHEDFGVAVSYVLHLAGRRVPEELSVLAFEFEGVSRFCLPGQSTLAQDFGGMAEAAVTILASPESGGAAPRIHLPYTLLERDSVARKIK